MKDVGIPAHGLNDIFVTRPDLPPLEDYVAELKLVWESRMLTNRGPRLLEFERRLCEHLGVEHISVVSNAAVGLTVALLHIGAREVITTPFSFVATANSIRLAGAKPVFADVEPETMGLDPRAVERLITPQTGAIVPVHCYGLPCDVEGFEALGQKYGIPVVYDAAHAFGVRHGGQSLLRYGTMSVLSFHATKVFNTAEGGAIIARDADTKRAIDRLCNHGISDETTVDVVGTNAKMNELQAALGLVQLRRIDAERQARAGVARRYARELSGMRGLRILCPTDDPDHNHYAFPVSVGPDFPLSRDGLQAFLRERGIVARRYFHPLIPHFAAYRDPDAVSVQRFPVAEEAAERVLCLPMYGALTEQDQMRVTGAIHDAAAGGGQGRRVQAR